MHNDTLVILHILTYYEFLRILLFSEIWIVIKKVGVGNLVIFCLFEYNIYIYISIRYIYIYIYIYIGGQAGKYLSSFLRQGF